MAKRRTKIDLVTQRPADGAFVLVVVEEGPWGRKSADTQLRRIQDRLYDCLDVAVDGHLASRYPESRGCPVIIRLACYDTPDDPVREFVAAFAEHVRTDEAIQRDIRAEGWVSSVAFEYTWDTLKQAEPGAAPDPAT